MAQHPHPTRSPHLLSIVQPASPTPHRLGSVDSFLPPSSTRRTPSTAASKYLPLHRRSCCGPGGRRRRLRAQDGAFDLAETFIGVH
ncbi:hypothetical protein GUJ93_ZPchr0006g44037 [Zizania palustris]|uniref:Uncharacterized protein n=1 Tax=Zizania palustris TaxID=103762 RepID=A0A8J5W2S4_ZIZPA|nr:hypothetical protein GUJ93_ZPchr0006g44037 [Zizania palustris]